ncbi:MAG TPA: Hsp20/alpha crystallin family protein [Pirellulales bacterium]|nr:Hsp20/alpha crystallin family protein [Pirellulales bacterium]
MTSEATVEKQSEPRPQMVRTDGGRVYRPNVDILEKHDELLVVADMPGVNAGEIDIHFEDGLLTIHGPAGTRQGEATRYVAQEYGVGDFYRTFRVSERIDATKISADYRDGVLVLHLPKTEAVKPRKIKVETN